MKKFIVFTITIIYPFIVFSQTTTIGGKTFEESWAMAKAASLLLKNEGYSVSEKLNVSTGNLRQMLLIGDVDCYFEYSPGTALTFYKGTKDFQEVKAKDLEKGLIWGKPAKFSNSWSVISTDPAYKRISDLEYFKGRVVVVETFVTRGDGFNKLKKHYGLDQLSAIEQGHAMVYKVLSLGEIRLGVGFETDPQILEQNLTVLEDDKNFFAKYYPTPICRKEHSYALEYMNKITEVMTLKDIQKLISEMVKKPNNFDFIVSSWAKEVGLQ